jgi:hypothetical protein
VVSLQAPAGRAARGDAHQEHGDKESLAAHHLALSSSPVFLKKTTRARRSKSAASRREICL